MCERGSGDIFFGMNRGTHKEFFNYRGSNTPHGSGHFEVRFIDNKTSADYCWGVKEVSQKPGGVFGEIKKESPAAAVDDDEGWPPLEESGDRDRVAL